MFELTADNVVEYLRESGRLDPRVPADAELLAGGVSNVVLRISPAEGPDFVIKQSRRQLRTELEWFSRLDRIWRERDVMATLARLLPPGAVPAVLYADTEQYLFAMEAVAADHVVWKTELLSGRADRRIAETAADYLAAIHGLTANDDQLRHHFGDCEVFVQLRVEPYYGQVASEHPDLKGYLDVLVDEMWENRRCLVHADFSPKNLLITDPAESMTAHNASGGTGRGRQLVLVDFETGHYGDPAFDLGFFLSHLLLKTVRHADRASEFLRLASTFLSRYRQRLGQSANLSDMPPGGLERRSIGHLAGCLLARIDGKSPIDYLPEPARRQFVRDFARELLTAPPPLLDAAFGRIGELIARRRASFGKDRRTPPGQTVPSV